MFVNTKAVAFHFNNFINARDGTADVCKSLGTYRGVRFVWGLLLIYNIFAEIWMAKSQEFLLFSECGFF